jgi:ubiquinone/menaquinone biosynthesis C-methylase UbiE
MKRKGIHKPTIEDIIELSGVETLHPGGFALTKRVAELANLRPGMKVLDVSSGRGTQSIFYAQNYGVEVIGVDISDEMLQTAIEKAKKSKLDKVVKFKKGDSQDLPFENNCFDVVINECAVGIPDNSQQVLNEMVRVAKVGGVLIMHESIWRKKISDKEKDDFSERYGTTPLEYDEWITMLKKAGVKDIITEYEEWSKPEMFWKIRIDRDVKNYSEIFTKAETTFLIGIVIEKYGEKGLKKLAENDKIFYKTLLDGIVGYCLFKGVKN